MGAVGYYADFVVFPIVLLGLVALEHRFGGDVHPVDAIIAMGCGVFFWTFLEYAIHRFILHGGRLFSQDHAAHHAEPKALIGSPVLLVLAIMVFGIYTPAIAFAHAGAGLMFGFGVTWGYLVYSFAHYSLHHWTMPDNGVLYRWKRLHALHHFVNPEGNFGVTSSLWDHVFGTAIVKKRAGVVK